MRLSRLRSRLFVPFLVALALSLVGCESFNIFGGDDPAEKRAERLQLPPDLSDTEFSNQLEIPGDNAKTYSAYAAGASDALGGDPASAVRVRRAAGQRWLEIDAAPSQVWRWVKDYLELNSIDLVREAPRLGIMQTEWLTYGTPVPASVFAPTVKQPGDAQVADQYMIRLERGVDGDGTEVYVAHRRIARQDPSVDYWEGRDADPFFEAELLRGLMIYVGVQERTATQRVAAAEARESQARLTRADDGTVQLLLEDRIYTAWRRVGLALDRVGFAVEDRDRAAGRYYIRYDRNAESGPKEKNFFEWIAFWRDDPDSLQVYAVSLAQSGDNQTLVQVTGEDGGAVEAEVAERILALIQEQLR